MGRFERSLSLMRSSWSVVRTDRELLVLPVISGITSLAVIASFAAPVWWSLEERLGLDATGTTVSTLEPTLWTYLLGAAFYFVSAFVVIFFNAALVWGANERFEGGNPTVGSTLDGARTRLRLIVQWAAVSATVSMVIRQIQERGGLLGRLLGGLIGFAWAVVTFLVLPTLVIEGVSVREAFSKSADSIKNTWGENLIGQGGLGILGFLAMLPCVALGVAGAFLLPTSVVLGGLVLGVAVVALLAVTVVLSAMNIVYQTALYRFATQRPIAGYDPAMLSAAFRPKGAKA